ncbi:ligase-associated DNA damage response DEXH box helicase [Fulvivirgaceae bacterium BMA10]|uniref:Ligase-associated DNA damage response DEXH box helicase n=1 Tax=Splendidivirga corallicola TaxID=3051826 RepID=A0ABT8KJY2_9BACT|nr:ligase-associated DNA damage response DEXH box helicase [Fulvivirgaceae bacterium BMA10]
MTNTELIAIGSKWFEERGWSPFKFQKDTWKAYLNNQCGLVNAPTGSGKTYSLAIPILLEFLRNTSFLEKKKGNGLQAIWITPIRALTKEIQQATQKACHDLGIDWNVAIRTGDTPTSERTQQKKQVPEFLITTPESMHLLLAQKDHPNIFKDLKAVVADEWHELLGTKRGVQVELALSRLKTLCSNLKVWGISATVGNMDEALQVLLGSDYNSQNVCIIRSGIKKKIEVVSVMPDVIEKFPWGGHLGIKLLEKVIPIIHKSKSTLIFTNTRSQCEIWYQRILEAEPELAGVLAMHHGSINKDLRDWVEMALHSEKLKAVVCTSSLDLGVDFRPVETIIQIGGAKGVSRFMQRAGRSGHQPGAKSKIYFVPTHSLELIEAAALRHAIKVENLEDRIPFIRSFDVLIQYLVTLAVGGGFKSEQILPEIRSTFCYASISDDEWYWVLNFITSGGNVLEAYDEFKKVEIEKGIYKVTDRRTAMRHRLSMGTIVGDVMMEVKYLSGGRIGSIEEWFIASMQPGDVFWFAGRCLELYQVKSMSAIVKKTKPRKGKIPSWQGGKMPLSSELAEELRLKLSESLSDKAKDVELKKVRPLLEMQKERSHVPMEDEFLIEYITTKEGHHLFVYPFEGRNVHEGMAALLGYRISEIKAMSFSIAMNDYGFELLADEEIPIEEVLELDAFSLDNLLLDIQASINTNEMGRRRFRDIATIAGLVFRGFPGKAITGRHLQSSSQLFYDVYLEYEPDNLLFKQAMEEVLEFQLQETRMRKALDRINHQKIVLKYPEKPTPFAFPIMVERIREKFSYEKLEDRIKRMTLKLEKS